MMFILLAITVVLILSFIVLISRPPRPVENERSGHGGTAWKRLDDAQAEAQRWVDRLSGSIVNLDGGPNVAAKQALADAAERLTAASSQLATATTPAQCAMVTESAIEGMYYIRAARIALGIDPGPDIPELHPGQRAGSVGRDQHVKYRGQDYAASPTPGPETPYYYPGGVAGGYSVPAGWYSTPWWKTALLASARVGGMLLLDALVTGMGPRGIRFDPRRRPGGFGRW